MKKAMINNSLLSVYPVTPSEVFKKTPNLDVSVDRLHP